MTINIDKLQENDKLIIETIDDYCYEFTILEPKNGKVKVYERHMISKPIIYFMSNSLDELKAVIEKDKCIVLNRDNYPTKILSPVTGVTLISVSGYELDIYPDKEKQEKMEKSLAERRRDINSMRKAKENTSIKIYKEDEEDNNGYEDSMS